MTGRGIHRPWRHARVAGVLALLSTVLAAAVSGAAAQGFSHATHPLAWLGARGMPGAAAFNLAGFVLPGLLAAVALWPLRAALPVPARWSARIGAQLVLLSAPAFAAQGLLPLDPEDLDSLAGGLHGAAWSAWWLAFLAGALALAWGLRGTALRRYAVATALAGAGTAALAVLVPEGWPAAAAQRAAFALWLAWVAWTGWRVAAVAGDGA